MLFKQLKPFAQLSFAKILQLSAKVVTPHWLKKKTLRFHIMIVLRKKNKINKIALKYFKNGGGGRVVVNPATRQKPKTKQQCDFDSLKRGLGMTFRLFKRQNKSIQVI